MGNQVFSVRSLQRLRRSADKRAVAAFAGQGYLEAVRTACMQIDTGAYRFSPFFVTSIRAHRVYSASNVVDTLVLRRVAENLKTAFNLQTVNRHRLMPTIALLADERVEKYIYRYDIRSFDAGINRASLLDYVRQNPRLSSQTLALLDQVFLGVQLREEVGIPRGISASAALGEILLRSVDTALRKLDAVYYYARYVDDVLIFASEPLAGIESRVDELLAKWGLGINKMKSAALATDLFGHASHVGSRAFEFLGYSVKLPTQAADPLLVGVSSGKISRIKRRIALSFRDFCRTKNLDLLLVRLRLLAGNFPVSGSRRGERLLSGIYYNHQGVSGPTPEDLRELDMFVAGLAFTKRGTIGRALGVLTTAQRRQIFSISFVAGFRTKIVTKVSYPELRAAKRVWRNA